MAASDARPVPRKNVAFRLYFAYRDDSNDLVTDWSTNSADAELSGDAGAFTGSATYIGTPTEIATNTGVGYVDITATGMNYDCVAVKATITGGNDVVILLYPEEVGDYRVAPDVVGSGVWHLATTGHVETGTYGEQCKTDIDNILVDTGTTLENHLTDMKGAGWTSTDTLENIYDDTNELVTDVNGIISGYNAVTVGTINADVITNTALATSAADEIADHVWDETMSDHRSADTTGLALITASGNLIGGSAPTEAEIWSYANRTLTHLGDVAVSGDVQQVVEDGLTAYDAATGSDITGLNDPTAADIADAVWDETSTGHIDAGKAGAQLWTDIDDILTDTSTTLNTHLTDMKGAGWTSTDTLENIYNDTNELVTDVNGIISGSNAVTVGTINTAVITADAIAANAITSSEFAQSAADKVWSTTSRTLTANTNFNDPTAAAIADAVWNETLSDHDAAGSTGHALVVASGNLIGSASGPDAATIADAVWDEDITAHVGGDKAGQALVTASGNLISGDWSTHSAADVYTEFGTGSNLTDVGLSATALNNVNAEVDTALNTSIPGTPTADSINERIKAIDDKLPSKSYITGTNQSDGDIDNVHTAAISSGSIATDAIGSSELADSAINEIVDQVWNEILADHDAPGSTGHALVVASGNLISGDWSTHGAADIWTEGSRTLSTQDWSTHSATDVAAIVGASGMIAQATWEYSGTKALSTQDWSTHSAADVANSVWTENINDHATTANSTAHALVTASGNLIGSEAGPDANTIATAVWDKDISAYTGSKAGTYLDNLYDNQSNWTTVTTSDMRTAVWDATLASYDSAGSTGQALVTASGNLIGAGGGATAQQVWEYGARSLTALGDLAVSGDVQAVVEDGLAAYDAATGSDVTGLNDPTAAAIADAVWTENITDHANTSNSTAHALVTASGNLISGNWAVAGEPLTQSEIRDAVGLATNNLDTQLTAIDNYVDTMEADIKSHGDTNWATADLTDIGASGMIAQAVWEYGGTRALTTQDWSTHSQADVWTTGGRTLSTQDWSTHSAADVWTNSDRTLTNLGPVAVSGDVQQIVEDGLTAYDAATGSDITGLNDPDVNAIADAVWNEDITAHVGGDKAGQALVTASGNLISGDWSTFDPTSDTVAQVTNVATTTDVTNAVKVSNSGDIANKTNYILGGSHGTGSWETATGFNTDTTADIVDAVWNETIGDHRSAGSAGLALITASGNLISGATGPDAATIADAVWDEQLGEHLTVNSAGYSLGIVASGLAEVNVIEVSGVRVGVDPYVDSNTVQVSGEFVSINDFKAEETTVDTAAIADAVWNRNLGQHLTIDSAGWALGIIGSGIANVNAVQVSGEYVSLRDIATGDLDTTGLATTTQLEYWALQILNNCGGGDVG